MFCAKLSWNWLSGSGEEDFYISSMDFRFNRYYIWTNLNPPYPSRQTDRQTGNHANSRGRHIFLSKFIIKNIFDSCGIILRISTKKLYQVIWHFKKKKRHPLKFQSFNSWALIHTNSSEFFLSQYKQYVTRYHWIFFNKLKDYVYLLIMNLP